MVKMTWLVCAVFVTLAICSVSGKDSSPNIVFMLADDLGWQDVQRHDSNMRTPNLEKLAQKGRELKYNYVLPTCCPTRAAMLTGRYPYRYGFQINAVQGFSNSWLNESLTLLPAYLKDAGYDTHMVGKWHLGYCNWSVTPLGRGFDTFYGFFSGAQGYFNHSGYRYLYYDFRDQREIVTGAQGKFSTELHSKRAMEIINSKTNTSKPFFLYMSYQSVHAPQEVKQKYVDDYCSHVVNATRKLYCGMVAAMDKSVGQIKNAVRKLQKRQSDRRTLIVFMSDNGGYNLGGGSNYPLRGRKSTLWEGGTRSYGLVYGPGILKGPTDTQYEGLIHAVDWLPTLLEAAGASVPEGLDGVPLWKEIRDNKITARSRISFIYNLDDRGHRSAARYKNFKLTQGTPGRKDNDNGWYPPSSFWNETIKWEEVDKTTLNHEQMFDIDKDPEERHDLLANLCTDNSDMDYVYEVLFARRQMLDMVDRGWEETKPFVRAEQSVLGFNISVAAGAFSPGGWCRS